MNKKKLTSLILGTILVSSTALAGCGGAKENPKDNKASKEDKMDKEQYLNVVLGEEPKSIDASKSTDRYSSEVLNAMMEGLTRIEQDKDGKDVIKKAGAEKWETSEDGLKWTFHLRDYKWSDGKKVTADQFAYAIQRTLDPATGSQYAFLLSPIKNADEYNAGKVKDPNEVGVKAVDDKTLEFTLKSPCAYFLDLTYFKLFQPQRKDLVEKHKAKYGTDANTMVSCGPFELKSWTHNSKMELVKNKEYWDKDNVKIEKLTMKIIQEEQPRMSELLNGSLDMGPAGKPEWVDKFEKSGKFNKIKTYDPGANYGFFNQKIKIFSNVKVRQAFSLAVTREDYAKTLQKGLGQAAYGWCPPTVQIGGKDYRELVGEEPIKKLKDQNPDPKKLLQEGLKELGMDEDPSKITVTTLQAGTNQTSKEYGEYEQQMFEKALGVKVKVDYVDWGVFLDRVDKGDYEYGGMAWTGDYNDPNTFFDMWTSASKMINLGGWKNDQYDKLIDTAAGTMDQDKRLDSFKKAEKIITVDDCVMVPIIYRMKQTFARKYIKGYMRPMFGTPEYKYCYTTGRAK